MTIGFPGMMWWFGQSEPTWVGLYLAVLLAIRFLRGFVGDASQTGISHSRRWLGENSVIDHLFLVGGAVLCIALLSGVGLAGLYYPVLVNLVLLLVFLNGVLHPPGVIEKMAMRQEPNFDSVIQTYTRNLTKLWCCFFVVNGGVCFVLAYGRWFDLWAWYSGVMSYVLIGFFLGIEWLLRGPISRRMRRN